MPWIYTCNLLLIDIIAYTSNKISPQRFIQTARLSHTSEVQYAPHTSKIKIRVIKQMEMYLIKVHHHTFAQESIPLSQISSIICVWGNQINTTAKLQLIVVHSFYPYMDFPCYLMINLLWFSTALYHSLCCNPFPQEFSIQQCMLLPWFQFCKLKKICITINADAGLSGNV